MLVDFASNFWNVYKRGLLDMSPPKSRLLLAQLYELVPFFSPCDLLFMAHVYTRLLTAHIQGFGRRLHVEVGADPGYLYRAMGWFGHRFAFSGCSTLLTSHSLGEACSKLSRNHPQKAKMVHRSIAVRAYGPTTTAMHEMSTPPPPPPPLLLTSRYVPGSSGTVRHRWPSGDA